MRSEHSVIERSKQSALGYSFAKMKVASSPSLPRSFDMGKWLLSLNFVNGQDRSQVKENEGEDKSLKSRNENRNYFSVIKWLLFVRIFNWRKRKWSQVLSCKFSQNSGTSYFPVSSPNEISCLCMIYLALTNPKHQNPATKPTGCWDVVVVQHVLVGLSWQSTFVWMNTFC